MYYLGAWFFCAIATMGKGPVGVVLPVACTFTYLATKRKWSELLRFEIGSGLLILLCVALPWYVAMYVRHGGGFTDRLIFHDMFNRAFGHVHDTNEGDDTSFRFYIWQLGYALFPWTALAPLGLTWWLRRSDTSDDGRGDASVLLAMWFVFSFGLFSFMGTKFHHYIFPAVPPIAMLIGVVLADMTKDEPIVRSFRSTIAYVLGLLASTGTVVYGLSRFWPGTVDGDAAVAKAGEAHLDGLGAALVLAGVAVGVWAVRSFGEPTVDDLAARLASNPASERRRKHEAMMVGAAALSGAVFLLLVTRDLGVTGLTGEFPGAARLVHLFTYNYKRPWPDSLDFSAILLAFGIVASAAVALLSVRRLWPHAVATLSVLAFVCALWGLDVYMIRTAPHWGQHEIIASYYRDRRGPEEPIVAYQMNWKGENFYTGNRIATFVSTGTAYTQWVKKRKEDGVRAIYIVSEHGRLGGLKSETGAKAYRELTDRKLNNKFVLVKAEF
jgi:hypothetical protein